MAVLSRRRPPLRQRVRRLTGSVAFGGCIAATLLPPLAAIYYVSQYTVDVPFHDEWLMVPMVDRWLTGRLSWLDLLERHNEHRILLARLVVIANASLTSWDLRYQCFVGLAFLIGTGLLVLWRGAAVMDGRAPRSILLVLVPASAALFGLRQWENLLQSFGVPIFGACFFFVLSVFLMGCRGLWPLLASLAATTISALSLTNGLLAWPIGLACLWVSRSGAERRNGAALWVAGALVFFAAQAVSARPGLPGASFDISSIALRGLAVLGATLATRADVVSARSEVGPLSWYLSMGTGAALLPLVMLGLLAGLARPASHAFSLSLLCFGLGSAVMVAVGRSTLAVQQALSPRYTTATVFVLIGLILLLAELRPRGSGPLIRRLATVISPALAGVVIFTNVAANAIELKVGPQRLIHVQTWAEKVRRYRTASDEDLRNPHFSPGVIREFSEVVERHRLSVFRDRP